MGHTLIVLIFSRPFTLPHKVKGHRRKEKICITEFIQLCKKKGYRPSLKYRLYGGISNEAKDTNML